MGNGESGVGSWELGVGSWVRGAGCVLFVCGPGLSGAPGQGARLWVRCHAVGLLLAPSSDGMSGRLWSLDVDPAVRRGRSGRAWLITGPGNVAQSSRWARCR
ncbi:hypothetical protein XaplCFBP3122_09515 [Xanthomonas arboricola pv. populi]|uniref:Uncharacterized protein n=1 Tax=Xanthomonas arboricola pv. populi TaxID=487823 RepID=A0A2S6Z5S1_9XANT|nr:hypothetical protein XaplCFBP3122_09515 [Xanthomonas arboricola pv. populi]